MLSKEKQMDVLEAYDLTKTLRAAAELAGVDHHTVARYVAARAAGIELTESERPTKTDGFAEKIIEWIERSTGKIRADVVHERLVAMGYSGSERTTRRVVHALKADYRHVNHRVYKPWIPEPGLWLQYDFGEGPRIDGVPTVLFCAWLAWSRMRVVIPLLDRTMPSVVAALDRTFRLLGGAPTYVLTDNEKTVTDHHIAGIPVRNESMVAVANYYGVTICTCVPYDPESKGGSESTVRIAKADLVPTEANLRDEYRSFAELEAACAEATGRFNSRVHSVTRRVPAEALEEEVGFLHAVADAPYSVAFGARPSRFAAPATRCPTRSVTAGSGFGPARARWSSCRVRDQRPRRWPATPSCTPAGPPSATSTIRCAVVIPSTVLPGRPMRPRNASWPSAKGPSATWSRRLPPAPGASRRGWPKP